MFQAATVANRPFLLLLAGLVAWLAPAELAAQTVHTVGPMGDFDSLSLAVPAAADGDIITVADGYETFEALVIDGKGLTIVAEGSAVLRLIPLFMEPPTLEVKNLAPGQAVIIRGIEFDTGDVDPETAVEVTDCQGPVLFEECILRPQNGIGLHVTDSDSVTTRDCLLSGGFGEFAVTGLRVDDSRVFLHDTVLEGGEGQPAAEIVFPPQIFVNGDGGDGAWIFGSSDVFMSGGALLGGDGGSASGLCFTGADGGNGFVLGNGGDTPRLRTQDVTIQGGAATAGGCGLADGTPGAGELVVSGTHVVLDGTARDFWMTAPVAVPGDVTMSFRGEPGDQVLLLLAPSVMPGFYLPVKGVALHLSLPFLSVPLGALPGSGELDLDLTVSSLPPAAEGVVLPGQAAFTAGGETVLSGPTFGVFLAP